MGFRIIAPKRIRKVKSKNSMEVLRRLKEYLESAAVTGEPIEILCRFWKDQQDAITYQELRQAVKDGAISQKTLSLWSQDYSVLVANRLNNLWTDAIVAGSTGQPILDGLAFGFNMHTPGILSWISERGAEFVTASTQEQKDAVAALLTKKMRDGHTVDELSRLIRPCIGLTERDAKAAVRLYDSIVSNLKKEHPRMKQESIRRKALDATQKYAERKHRARALTIAQTESAFAYNRGADEGIRQAQSQNLLGIVKKRWSTSGDDGVCDICNALDGVEVGMEGEFPFKGKILFLGHHMLPPAHPRCACAVEYIEIEKPILSSAESLVGSERVYFDAEKSYKIELEDYDQKTNEALSKAAKKVAETGSRDGYEYSALIDLDKGKIVDFGTDKESSSVSYFFKYIREHKGDKFAMVHNHNTESEMSFPDVQLLANTNELKIVASVTNNGIINVVETNGVKTKRYLPVYYEKHKNIYINNHPNYNENILADRIGLELYLRDLAIEEFGKGGIKWYGR